MLRVLLLFSSLFVFSLVVAGEVPSRDTMDVGKYRLLKKMRPYAYLYKDSNGAFSESHLEKIPFADTLLTKYNATPLVGKTLYLRCVVKNSGDTALTYFFNPGFYFTEIKIFEHDSVHGGTKLIQDYGNLEKEGYKRIIFEPGESRELFFKLKLNKSDVNNFDPGFVHINYLKSYQTVSQNDLRLNQIITFVLSGILLMMIFYALAVFMLNKNTVFLYYACYAFFYGLMFFLIAFTNHTPSTFSYFLNAYFDFSLMCVGTFFYIEFLKKFIDSKKRFPHIHKLVLVEQLSAIIGLLWISFQYFFTDNFGLQMAIENITKLFWIAITVAFVIIAFRSKDKILRYLAMGHSFLLLFAAASFFIILYRPKFGDGILTIFKPALFYFEIGITIELVFFLGALAFKNRSDIIEKTRESERLKILSERQDLEKQLAVFSAKQEERNRISADMHDELGSGVTAIRLMSEIVKQKMKEQTLPEIDRISSSANDLISKMNTLIWTMKSENDTLESLVAYLRTYAFDFFENTAINCHVKMPPLFRHVELTGEKRRNIFLTVKETLNNILKHSKAQDVTMSFEINDHFLIRISDNGVGINFEKLRKFGSGLKNMKLRIEGMGGKYTIFNNEETGATTTIQLTV